MAAPQLGYKVSYDELGRTYCKKEISNISSTLSETEIQFLAVGVQAFQGGFLQTSGNSEKYLDETKEGIELFKQYIANYNSIIWNNKK